MRKKFLKVSLLTLALMFSYSHLKAESFTLTGTVEVQDPPVTVTKIQDMTLRLNISPTETRTSFSRTDLSSYQGVVFQISAKSNAAINISVPSSVTLSNTAGNQATISLVCKSGYDTSTLESSSSGCSSVTTNADGNLYIGLYPDTISFSATAPGTYTGTITITADY